MYQYRMLEKWEFEQLKKQIAEKKYINDGSEGIVLFDPRDAKQAIKLHNHPTLEKELQLQELCDRKMTLHYSTLPYGGVYFEYMFLGSYMKYFKNYMPLLKWKYARTQAEINEKLLLSKYVYRNSDELYKNDIFLIDLDLENILVHPKTKDTQIIDLDSDDVSLKESSKKEFLKRLLETLLDLYFIEYPFIGPEIHKAKEESLIQLGFSNSFVKQMLDSKNISLELIQECMDKVEKDQLISKQFTKINQRI